MINKEYLTVTELSKHHKVSARHIRRIIEKLNIGTTDGLLYKDANNIWMVHHMLLNRFKPQRVRKEKYYALTIDPISNYEENEIHEILSFVSNQFAEKGLEINYTVESKKANGRNHIHCFIKCKNKKRLLQLIRLGFSSLSYSEADIYNLDGWKSYITKENNNIRTIKN
jgi:transcriptional antiterminator